MSKNVLTPKATQSRQAAAVATLYPVHLRKKKKKHQRAIEGDRCLPVLLLTNPGIAHWDTFYPAR
jgi:hypothetical protein